MASLILTNSRTLSTGGLGNTCTVGRNAIDGGNSGGWQGDRESTGWVGCSSSWKANYWVQSILYRHLVSMFHQGQVEKLQAITGVGKGHHLVEQVGVMDTEDVASSLAVETHVVTTSTQTDKHISVLVLHVLQHVKSSREDPITGAVDVAESPDLMINLEVARFLLAPWSHLPPVIFLSNLSYPLCCILPPLTIWSCGVFALKRYAVRFCHWATSPDCTISVTVHLAERRSPMCSTERKTRFHTTGPGVSVGEHSPLLVLKNTHTGPFHVWSTSSSCEMKPLTSVLGTVFYLTATLVNARVYYLWKLVISF